MLTLGIDSLEDEFSARFRHLGEKARIVFTAPTGSGKSTRVPVWCRRATGAPVLVVEPRRVAAKTLAGWVGQGLAETGAEKVGYSVRFESEGAEDASVLFVTPGVCRRMLVDGKLERFGTVIFDEFHERSWETDALLALLAASAESPRLVLMSATLTATRLCDRYQAGLMEWHGRTFPVEVVYSVDPQDDVTMPSSRRLVERTVEAVKREWNSLKSGSVLVFLPGLQSMREVASSLGSIPTALLHGAFGSKEQAKAFDQSRRRVVLATNVAESSLTIADVAVVVDAGLERRQIHQSGYVALSTVPIARTSAEQRAGRAGRVSAGRCVRLWAHSARLEAVRPPDICRMELDELVLFFAALPEGLDSPVDWLDPPPEFAWNRARERLENNGLLDRAGRLTELGRRAERLPVEQDWARVLLLAPESMRADLCDLCALASARRSPLKATQSEEVLLARKNDLGEEPWSLSLAVIRQGNPVKHGLEAESLETVRKISRDLKEACGASGGVGSKLQSGLREFLAEVWPSRFFLLREGRNAWGNGRVECRLPRGEELPADCVAAFFLQIQPVVSRGLKVELQGRSGLPVRLSLLREAGLGVPKLSKIRWIEGRLQARVSRILAGRELGSSEEILSGAPLREALVKLAREGGWGADSLKAIEDELFYERLYGSLRGDSEEEFPSPEQLLELRLERLGVESADDLQLLETQDLLEPTVPEWELEKLRSDYPRLYSIGGVSFALDFDPKRRLVVMNSLGHGKGVKINPQHLPRWNGWRVELDEKGRRTTLR